MIIKITSKISLFLLSLCLLSFNSCVSYKNVPYFQDLDSNQVNMSVLKYQQPIIQKNDILGIYITSKSEQTNVLFGVTPSETQESLSPNSNGFLVDDEGNVQLATIGKVKAAGLTTLQLQEQLVKAASVYVNSPVVVVRILNFKVSVNGDVVKAGIFNVPNGKVTVLEAITMAGDLRVTAKRENVLVVRQEEGETKFARLDLRSKKVFQSPYFYLKNNDMIYVEPNLKLLERDQNVYKNITVIVGILTAIALIYSRIN